MTWNGVMAVTLPYFTEFGADYVKVVEDTEILSATESSPKNLIFSDLSLMAIFAEVTENECIIKRHLCDPSKSANVTSTSEIVRDRGRDNCSMWTLVQSI